MSSAQTTATLFWNLTSTIISMEPVYSSTLSWFSSQDELSQITAVDYVCYQSNFPKSLCTDLKKILDNPYSNAVYHETESLFWTTLPDSSKGLVWLPRVVANICMGYVLKPDMRLFTIPEIQDVFDVYTNYLNQTNSIRSGVVKAMILRYVIEPFQRHMHAYFGFAVIAGVALVAFCGVLLWDLVAIKVKQSTVSRAIAPFNIALFVCCAMNLIDSIASYMIWKFSVYSRITNVYDSIAIQRRLYMVSECSIVIWILAYLYFSWMRSETILVQVWTRGVQLIRILFFASPFVILLPLIPEFISIAQGGGKVGRDYIEKSFILQAFASSYLLVLDAILLLTFTRYISTLEKEMEAATSRFLIIARGGVAATSFSATAVNSEVFKLTMAGLQHTVTWCLLLMKVFLVMDSLAKTDKNKTIDRSTSAKHLRLTKSEGLEFQ
ncbi:hypothetical protein BCR33DRAFT_711531 [Rhizoclosmatium globosum]|uniref:Uncharacterized protein n=1 Tax=Rhizoclosmatium globosum TaxID=329046 RepID=A0A1Y2D223_9FUNG|nr:hypothetical protein BCR33DRAFT_711531 [Rhizoclosmatium globosum]|eukprot:ORY53184.1 hypothetical protein BCR33DRAFT_711531 [Rhizoclosmatium globosum]